MSVEDPNGAVRPIDCYRAAGVIEWRLVDTWSRRVGDLISLPVLIAKLDIDLPHVMAVAGLPVDALNSPEHRVPLQAIGRLFDAATDMSGQHDLGLRLGSMVRLDDLGIIGDLARNAATLDEALRFMVAYQHLNSEGDLVFVARHDPIVEVGYAIYYPGVKGVDQMCDYALAALFTVLRELAGSQWLPSEVFLPHASPPQALQYENLFGGAPHFNAEFCSLRFPAYWLNHPVEGADPAQRRRALDGVQQAADADLLQQVCRALRQLMLSNRSSGDDVADMLSMNRRTLNRRLRERGTTFQHVLDSVRCEVARQLLVHSQLPLEDVAASLGYAGASPFMRSFRRWTGSSPGDFRKLAHHRKRPHGSTESSLNTLRGKSNADPESDGR